MKIMILSSEFHPFQGGIGTYAFEMARAATELGHSVTVVAADYGGQAAVREFPFRVLRYSGGQHRMRDMPAKIALVRRLARQMPDVDIVHAVDWPFYIPLALSGYRNRARCILTFHGSEVGFIRKPIRTLPLAVLQFWDGWAQYVANSRDTARRLRAAFSLPESDVRVINLGVGRDWLSSRVDKADARQALDIREDHFVIATLGRVVPRKGHDLLAKALHALPVGVAEKIEWQIIGPLLDTVYADRLRRMIASLPCRVVMTGALPQHDVNIHLSAADVFCLPGSQRSAGDVEGFGLVYLEAGAIGLPSVATDVGGVCDAIDHGKGGVVVPRDDCNALAAALQRLISDPAWRAQLSQGARHRAETSSWLKTARETYDPTDVGPARKHELIAASEVSA